jgi:hypothetical protein
VTPPAAHAPPKPRLPTPGCVFLKRTAGWTAPTSAHESQNRRLTPPIKSHTLHTVMERWRSRMSVGSGKCVRANHELPENPPLSSNTMKVKFVPYGKIFLVATLVVGFFVGLVCGCFLCSFIDRQKQIQCSSNLKVCWFIMNDSAESLNTSYPITNSFVLHQVIEIAKHRIHMQQIACPRGGDTGLTPFLGA